MASLSWWNIVTLLSDAATKRELGTLAPPPRAATNCIVNKVSFYGFLQIFMSISSALKFAMVYLPVNIALQRAKGKLGGFPEWSEGCEKRSP